MRIGLVLLPTETTARELEALSQRVAPDAPSTRVVLGPGRAAHVTLLHVESDDDPEILWREAARTLPHRIEVDPVGLAMLHYAVPYNAPPAPPGTMAWLILQTTPTLRAAETAALALPSLRGRPIPTGNGARFQPHVTLAIWEGAAPPSVWLLPEPLRPPFEATLALGVIGPNGVYARTLFAAPP